MIFVPAYEGHPKRWEGEFKHNVLFAQMPRLCLKLRANPSYATVSRMTPLWYRSEGIEWLPEDGQIKIIRRSPKNISLSFGGQNITSGDLQEAWPCKKRIGKGAFN
jgi:hypothetical protein